MTGRRRCSARAPLCVYPLVARWTGKGSTDDAADFSSVSVPRSDDGPAEARPET